MKFETKAIHYGPGDGNDWGTTVTPLYQSAAFSYESPETLKNVFEGKDMGYVYSRISNPTVTAFEQKITALENARGSLAFASGMAAIHAVVLGLAQTGDNFISGASLFSGTTQLFRDIVDPNGIEIKYADAIDVAAVDALIDNKTRFIFVEALGNPKLDIPDIAALAQVANKHHIPLVVDTTIVTPYLVQAKSLGAHIVVSAATKYMAASGTSIGGVVVDLGTYKWKESTLPLLQKQIKDTGNFAFLARLRNQVLQNVGYSMAPMNAFLFATGLETLSIRMARHCENAVALAQFLASHPAVTEVNYPGLPSHASHEMAKKQFAPYFGGLLTIRLGNQENCYAVLSALKVAKTMTNMGDSRTLIIHAASTLYHDLTKEERLKAGVYDDLCRISVGLEHHEDLIDDFKQALATV